MRKFENIIQSETAPKTSSLWLKEGKLLHFNNGHWEQLSGSDITEDKVKELCDDKLSNVILKDITVGKEFEVTPDSTVENSVQIKFTLGSTDLNALGVDYNKYKYCGIALKYQGGDSNKDNWVCSCSGTVTKPNSPVQIMYTTDGFNSSSFPDPDPNQEYKFARAFGCYITKDDYAVIYDSIQLTSNFEDKEVIVRHYCDIDNSVDVNSYKVYLVLFKSEEDFIKSNMTNVEYGVISVAKRYYMYRKLINIDSTLEADTFDTFISKNLAKDYQSVQTYIDTAVNNLSDKVNNIPIYKNNTVGENGDGIYIRDKITLKRITNQLDIKDLFYLNDDLTVNENIYPSLETTDGSSSIESVSLINVTAKKNNTLYYLFEESRDEVGMLKSLYVVNSQISNDLQLSLAFIKDSFASGYIDSSEAVKKLEYRILCSDDSLKGMYLEDALKLKGYSDIKYTYDYFDDNIKYNGITKIKDEDRVKVSLDNNTDSLVLKSDLLDLFTYGVSWDVNQADPHLTRIGNMTYHKSLPIQNGMRGCIVQFKNGLDVKYYLDDNDWRLKYTPRYPYQSDSPITDIDGQPNAFVGVCSSVEGEEKTVKITDTRFSTKRYEKQYVRFNEGETIFQITSIDTSTNTATLKLAEALTIENIPTGDTFVEMGSVTSGYDGELMLEVPEFWIKSWVDGNKREVRISPTYIDETWEHSPKTYISPFKDTMLITVPENMGYLSTLEAGSAVCICNTEDYCKGGDTTSTITYTGSLNGKHRTNIALDDMRTAARKSGKEVMSYLQYKRIMYWLYVIEYANFDCQENYNAALTSEGFKQGGLGTGVTGYKHLEDWGKDNYNPIVENNINYCNPGAHSVIVYTNPSDSSSSSVTIYPWHHIVELFGDTSTILDGVIIGNADKTENGIKYNAVYATDYPSNYGNSIKMNIIGYEVLEGGLIKEFDLGSTAEIIPTTVGGSTTTYKCDNHVVEDNSDYPERLLIVGSDASDSGEAGIGFFNSSANTLSKHQTQGFRTAYVE